jgi:hypothetical protein
MRDKMNLRGNFFTDNLIQSEGNIVGELTKLDSKNAEID